MASKRRLSAKDLRSFYDLGQKRDKSASSSQNSQGQTQNPGSANPTPSVTPPPPSPKRQRLEGTSEIPNTNATNQVGTELIRLSPVDRVPEKWWLYFREFESGEDMSVTSIFYHLFQMNEVIEGNLCKPADRARIQKVGLHNTAIMAQSMAARTAFLAHGLGHGIEVLKKENSELRQKLKTLGNADNIIRDLSQKLTRLEVEAGRVTSLSEEVDNQKSRVQELESENKTLSEEKVSLSSTVSLLREEKEKIRVDFDAARNVWRSLMGSWSNLSNPSDGENDYVLESVENFMAKSETWLTIADSQSRWRILWPSPRLGWRLSTPRVGGEFYGQVRDLVGDCRLPESVENFMAKSETWLAIVDSQSRWKILWPVRDLVGDCRLPESVGNFMATIYERKWDSK
ncbi:hypothetical protein SESBI_35841 [Sesbania bispinosa]|nr:hypothetical protein SESBI_35841 [Sesbania bispinosa]